MPFQVGDKVVHPRIGAGRIVGVSQQELVAGFQDYFVIEIPGKDSTIYIPMSKVEELGVRPVMSRAKVAHVLAMLSSTPEPLSSDAKERQKDVQEKKKSGDPFDVAKVIRDLAWHKYFASITKKDSELLNQARDFLAAEIALAEETPISEGQEKINIALVAFAGYEEEETL